MNDPVLRTDDDRSLPGGPGASDAQLAKLIDSYGADVFRVAVAVVRDHGLAEDVVQEVLLRVWRSLPESAAEVPAGWLRVVTRNVAIDVLRRRRFYDVTELPPDAVSTDASTDRIVEGRQHLDAVWDALALLDEDTRAMLVLRETEGLDYQELAEMFDISLSSVKTKLYRARHALRAHLKDWEA